MKITVSNPSQHTIGDKAEIARELAESLWRFLFNGKEKIQYLRQVSGSEVLEILDLPTKKGWHFLFVSVMIFIPSSPRNSW